MAIKNRIQMIDALRGLALSGILLLHHIEHFNFYKKPTVNIDWLIPIDNWVWEQMFLLASGKAFALFSLLFGFSYWLIYQNAQARGENYLFRHFWRMALLAGFGVLHIMFFPGEILLMYAVLGLPLVLTRYMSNRAILLCAGILLINPINLYTLFCVVNGSAVWDFRLPYPKTGLAGFLTGDSYWTLVKAGFSYGYQETLVWSWNVGRMLTIPGLFLIGVYLAKTKSLTERPLAFWYKLLATSVVCWLLFDLAHDAGVMQITEKLPKQLLKSAADTYVKTAMMFAILSSFVIIWRHNDGKIGLQNLANFGRMGLTNYLLMSVIGAFLYFGWGLGLYQYCGSTITLFIGMGALTFQMWFSSKWLAHFDQGPLEKLWRECTWIGRTDNRQYKFTNNG